MLLDLLATGRLIDIILGLVCLEALAVGLLNKFGIIGLRLQDIAATLLSGVFLMIALKFALTGAGTLAIAGCLALALVSHSVDVAQRVLGTRPD